jgi:tetratricopeptide (TPR) repeat protein
MTGPSAGACTAIPSVAASAGAGEKGAGAHQGPVLAALLVGIALVYGGSLFAGFVWDDASVIFPAAARPPVAAVRRAFTGGVVVDGIALGYFRPLVDLSYALDGWLWGPRPFGFHLTNLLLYALCVALAHRLARRLLGSAVAAAAAAITFALHPVHVESVAWVQGRGDLLAFIGVAAAMLAFLRALEAERAWPWGMAAATAALGGALAKEWALMVLFLAAAWWVLVARREAVTAARALRALAPFPVALAAYAVLRAASGVGIDAGTAPALLTTGERWRALAPTFTRYLGLLLWPHPLSTYHTVAIPAGPLDLRVVAGGLCLAGTLAAAWWAARRAPRAAFALWWFLLALLPVLPVMPIKGFTMAERYLFLPSFGFALGVGLLGARLYRAAGGRRARWALGAAGTAVAVAWGGAAAARVPDWTEQVTFYRAMVRSAPDSAFAQNNLGQILVAEGLVAEGIQHLRQAVALRPDMAYAHAGLGLAYRRQGDLARAVAALETAARLRPDDPRILDDLASALEAQGRAREALAVLHRLEAARPASADVARRLGEAFAALGDRLRANGYSARAERLGSQAAGGPGTAR